MDTTLPRYASIPAAPQPVLARKGMAVRGARLVIAQPDGTFVRDMRASSNAYHHPDTGVVVVDVVSERRWYMWVEQGVQPGEADGVVRQVPADMTFVEVIPDE